jgi:hypothetical protein
MYVINLYTKYTFIIFAAHLATSCDAPCENHCSEVCLRYMKFREYDELPKRRICLGHFTLATQYWYKIQILQL